MTNKTKRNEHPEFADALAFADAAFARDADPEGAAFLAEREGERVCEICGEIFPRVPYHGHVCDPARKPDPADKICEHGKLRRSCEVCERDARIAELEAECERLRGFLTQIRRYAVEHDDHEGVSDHMMEITEAALASGTGLASEKGKGGE